MVTKVAPSKRNMVAYLRVSTLDQGLEKNKADFLHFANYHDLSKVNFVEKDCIRTKALERTSNRTGAGRIAKR